VRRIHLIHSVILSIGGIPLIYLGDEIGMLNDYSYRNDPAKAGDSRWVHRPFADWARSARRETPGTIEYQVNSGLRRLIAARRETPAFADSQMAVVDAGNPHVFGYLRQHAGARILILANFSEGEQRVAANTVRNHGLSYAFRDLVSGQALALRGDLTLAPYQFLWLEAIETT
jgi:amylosucrase